MGLTFGVALDFGSGRRGVAQQLERQTGLLASAEAAGFELVAAGESALGGSFHLPDALQVLAAICQRTRLRLCTGIALLPAWDAWKLALDAAQLDQLSGGRLVLGVGIGTPALQMRAGWDADAISPTVDEYLAALRALWTGGAGYAGSHLRVADGLPILPLQPNGPPIWVGGTVRRSAVRAARYGQGWYAGINFRCSQLPRNVGWYHSALGDSGQQPEAGAVIINRLALAAATSHEVTQLVETYLGETLRAYGGGEPLQSTIDDVGLVGTPDQIVAQLEQYRAGGVTHVFARLSLDEMPVEVAQQTIEVFGGDIIPRLANDA